MCGECCRGLKEGEVYLYLEDIKRLSDVLKLKGTEGLRQFAEKYLKITNDSFYWKKPGAQRRKKYFIKTLGFKFIGDDEHCEFLMGNKCSIHEARPFQCRCFPFWQMMIKSPKEIREYAKKCPGLRDLNSENAKYYSGEEIYDWARREYELEKKYFLKLKRNNFNIFKVYKFLPADLPEDEN